MSDHKVGYLSLAEAETVFRSRRADSYEFLCLDQLGAQIRQKRMYGIRRTAAEIGISPTTLSKVENGHLPDMETLEKLCEWCGLSLWLRRRSDD